MIYKYGSSVIAGAYYFGAGGLAPESSAASQVYGRGRARGGAAADDLTEELVRKQWDLLEARVVAPGVPDQAPRQEVVAKAKAPAVAPRAVAASGGSQAAEVAAESQDVRKLLADITALRADMQADEAKRRRQQEESLLLALLGV